VIALSAGGKLPTRVAADMAAALFGIEISPGVVNLWRRRLAEGLSNRDDAAIAALKASPVLGADETLVVVTGMSAAMAHVVVNKLITRFHLAGRSKKAITSCGVLGGFKGRLVTM